MRYAIIIVLLACCLHSLSQQAYSLQDCFNAAKGNNISLKRSRNNIENAYIEKKAATYNLFPAVYANAEHIFSSGKNIDPVTNNFVRDNFSGGVFDVTLELNIFSGFNALNAIKSSMYKIKAGEFAYKKNELDMFSAITMAYAKLMFAKEQANNIKNDNLLTENELNIIQEKINVGKLSKSDYYTVSTRYKSEQASLAEAEHDSTEAMSELKYLVGVEYNAPFNVKEIDSAEMVMIASVAFNSADLIEKVLKNNPAMQASLYTEKSAYMDLKTAKGNMMPNVSLTGNLFSNYNLAERNINGNKTAFGEQLDNNFGKTVGVLVEIPLFTQNKNRIAVQKEKINLSDAQLLKQETESEIEKSTQQLLNDFLTAQKKYLLQTESLQQGMLAYEAFRERHKLGYISSLELLLAKDQLYAQQVKAAQAKYDLYFAYQLINLLFPEDHAPIFSH